ncbi:MAG: helix-turn-helix domain-containing protein [Minisyncoccia bacterium]
MAEEEKKEIVSLGKFLATKRLEKGVSLEKVSQETKILASYLKSIEEDNYSLLPPPAYVKAIVKKYAQYLRLNIEEVLNLLKEINHRQWAAGEKDLLPKNRFSTPQMKLILFLRNFSSRFLKYLFIFLIIFYLLYEISFLIFPPKILLFSPAEDISTTEKELLITGKVIRGRSVLLKNQPLSVDEKGYFSYTLILNPGLNQIELKATNHLGWETTVIRNINYILKN